MEENVVKKKSRIPVLVAIGVLLLTAVVVIIVLVLHSSGREKRIREQLTLAEHYLDELEYEQAVLAYQAVIELEPKCVEAYLGMAEAYVGLGDIEKAISALEEGFAQTENSGIRSKLEELEELREDGVTEDGSLADGGTLDILNSDGSGEEALNGGRSEEDTQPEGSVVTPLDEGVIVPCIIFNTKDIIPVEILDGYDAVAYPSRGARFEQGVTLLLEDGTTETIYEAAVWGTPELAPGKELDDYMDETYTYEGIFYRNEEKQIGLSDSGSYYNYDPYDYVFSIWWIVDEEAER